MIHFCALLAFVRQMVAMGTYGFAGAEASDLEGSGAVAGDATGAAAVEVVVAGAAGLSLKKSLIFFQYFFNPFFSFFGGCACSLAIIGEEGWNA